MKDINQYLQEIESGAPLLYENEGAANYFIIEDVDGDQAVIYLDDELDFLLYKLIQLAISRNKGSGFDIIKMAIAMMEEESIKPIPVGRDQIFEGTR